MRKIRWGILGTGNIANSFAKDFKFVSHGVIDAVASRSINKAKAFAEKYQIKKAYDNYENLLHDAEIDVVYIATPHNFHFQNASDSLNAGKAVVCEKPITINAHECRQLIQLANSSGQYLMEAMWTYFLPAISKAMHWVEDGQIGEIRSIKADFGFKANKETEKRLFLPEFAGGALLDIGIYPLALATLICKSTPMKITVFSKKLDTGVDGEETVILEYPDGVLANVSASITYAMSNEALIIGEKGYIRIPDFFMAKECFLIHKNQVKEHFVDSNKCVGYSYEIDAVNLDILAGNNQSAIMPLSSSLLIQQIIEKVKRSF